MSEAAQNDPAAGERARGATGSCNERDHTTPPRPRGKPSLTVSWGDGDAAATMTFEGREAQTLKLLLAVGPHGFTSGDASPLGWARRTSHYVFKLRAAGLDIATTRETVADGTRVGRYTLATPVRIISRGAGG